MSYNIDVDSTTRVGSACGNDLMVFLKRIGKNLEVVSYTSIYIENSVFDWDYHFMVQTSTGQWAEKHGRAGTSICHEMGMTPDTISWDLGNREGYYDSEIIYIAVIGG